MDADMDFPGFLDSIDTIFYGRVSYDTWGNFQPGGDAPEEELEFWKDIHSKKKYVFTHQTRTDSKASSIHNDISGNVAQLKQQPGKDIWLYGGASLIRTFIQQELIDVYRISVHPVVLGSGKPLFEGLESRINFKLVNTNVFASGVVQLIYEPK